MEKILQYAWQWRMYGSEEQHLTDGRAVRILDPGTLNTGSGPDFFNAKIVMDGCEWAGNVELHLKASDWWRHGHHRDPAYDNIILHVVADDDASPVRSDGSPIPQLIFPLTPTMQACYRRLTESSKNPPAMPCALMLSSVDRIYLDDVIVSACRQRMQEKRDAVIKTVRTTGGDWSKAVLCAVARSLGFGVNSEPLERLALSLDLMACEGHSDDLRQLEAILYGQANLLAGDAADEYQASLQREYEFLKRKYSMRPMPEALWLTGRVRPANSPYRRIALLALLLRNSRSLLSKILSAGKDIDALRELFTLSLEGYWSIHTGFGKVSRRPASTLSREAADVIIINAVVPVYMAYGYYTGDVETVEQAQELLEALPAEKNRLVRDWADAGVRASTAEESQGLIQIRKRYCDARDCLRCRLGHRMLRRSCMPVDVAGKAVR